jgi:multimeric flavodoxin WrbA
MKNIVIVTGSPRKGGNTDLLAEAFREGAEQAGHKVTIFDAGKRDMKPCIACNKCYGLINGTPRPCAHDEAFNELAPLIEKADVMVFATPMYWSDFSAQIKLAIDHMYGMGGSNHKLEHVKEACLIADAMSPESAFGCLTATYRQIVTGLGWKDAGVVIAGGLGGEPGSVRKTAALEKAKKLGASL